MDKKKEKKRSSIGGQAVLEGVMMRGATVMATAVRNPDGNIVVESKRIRNKDKKKSILLKIPVLRGVLSFFSSIVMGTRTLLRSAEVWGDIEAEPTKFENWLAKKTKIDLMDIAVGIGLVVGLGFSIVLFFILPTLIVSWLRMIPAVESLAEWARTLIEGIVRILIFVSYILLVSNLKDIKRTFMYHGAEHKVISCYEHQLPLNVENTKSLTTIHDRCGTTFLFIVMVVAIIIFSLVASIGGEFGRIISENLWARVGIRLLLLPLVAGISYEFLKLFSLSDNFLFRLFKLPGLLLQKLTTKEPTDDMVEVAIVAFNTVLEMENDSNLDEQSFKKSLSVSMANHKNKLIKNNIDLADLDWMACAVLGIKRNEIASSQFISEEQENKLKAMVERRLSGEPVQYIIGHTDFYGVRINVNKNVLIPRLDSEVVAESAIKLIKDKGYNTALDICTGSGAIALAIKNELKEIAMSASDISEEALSLAAENAALNNLEIAFIKSDLTENIKGKYDLIVCNPPYVSESEYSSLDDEVKKWEPQLALVGGEDGLLYYKKLSGSIMSYLNNNGALVLEIGYTQADAVNNLFKNYNNIQVLQDMEGRDRVVIIINEGN